MTSALAMGRGTLRWAVVAGGTTFLVLGGAFLAGRCRDASESSVRQWERIVAALHTSTENQIGGPVETDGNLWWSTRELEFGIAPDPQFATRGMMEAGHILVVRVKQRRSLTVIRSTATVIPRSSSAWSCGLAGRVERSLQSVGVETEVRR